jgi:patatin-like phospholipase/acyl hydrolase
MGVNMIADNIIIILRTKRRPLDGIPVSSFTTENRFEYRTRDCSASALEYYGEQADGKWTKITDYNKSAAVMFSDHTREVFYDEDEAYESVEDDYAEYGTRMVIMDEYFEDAVKI